MKNKKLESQVVSTIEKVYKVAPTRKRLLPYNRPPQISSTKSKSLKNTVSKGVFKGIVDKRIREIVEQTVQVMVDEKIQEADTIPNPVEI